MINIWSWFRAIHNIFLAQVVKGEAKSNFKEPAEVFPDGGGYSYHKKLSKVVGRCFVESLLRCCGLNF